MSQLQGRRDGRVEAHLRRALAHLRVAGDDASGEELEDSLASLRSDLETMLTTEADSGVGPGPVADESPGVVPVVRVLEDSECRRILQSTRSRALTVEEIADLCDVSLSTAYRKTDRLTDVSLLRETVRLAPHGPHASEYRRAADGVYISFAPSFSVELDPILDDETDLAGIDPDDPTGATD